MKRDVARRRRSAFCIPAAAVVGVLAATTLTVVSWGATSAAAGSNKAYVANQSSNTVSVIDTGSNTVVATVAVPQPAGVAVSPDGTRLYVTNQSSNTLTVIDTATNALVTTVAVGTAPSGVAVSPSGARVYVVNSSSVPGTVSVINTATNTVVATVAVGAVPETVAVSSDDSRAYVANQYSDTVSVIDTATATVVATVATGEFPVGVAVSPGGSRAYVANFSSGTVSVIDTATNAVVAAVGVGKGPQAVTVSPDGSRAYTSDSNADTVSVIDTATNTVMATVAVGTYPEAVAVSPDGSHVYVTNLNANTVSVISTATNTVVATVPVGVRPFAVAMSPAMALSRPSLTTAASPPTLVGGPVRDVATLGGGTNPSGHITFKLYGPDDAACAHPQATTSVAPVSGDGSYFSDPFTPTVPGTYRWTADYSGDGANAAVSAPCNAADESVAVKPFAPPPCTTTLTGEVSRSVTVNAGKSLCIIGARVAGSIMVNPGGALTVTASRIRGGIVADRPSFFSLCGSQVSRRPTTLAATVIVSNAAVPLRIGDPAMACASNRVSGDMILFGNTGGLTVGANILSGSLVVDNNAVGTDVVKANVIIGILACTGNKPPPINGGQPNRARRGKTGECAAL